MKGVSIGRMGIMAQVAGMLAALAGSGQQAQRSRNSAHVRGNVHGGGAGKKRRRQDLCQGPRPQDAPRTLIDGHGTGVRTAPGDAAANHGDNMGKRKAEAELPWSDIEVSTPRGVLERVSLSVMEVRPAYTSGDGFTYAGPVQYVVTAWVAEDTDRHRPVNLRCRKLCSGIVYQVGDCFRTVGRATAEMEAVKVGRDWEAWRWMELEEVRS